MHFPLPMPAFDVFCIDSPYDGIGSWQNRVFAVPPAMGIDYRCVNGYIYISGNAVTDPEKIAERAEYFQERAGHYFQNWNDLYAKWRVKVDAMIRELTELEVPDLPEYEPREVVFENDRNLRFYDVLDAYSRTLRLGDLMWQHHSEFLLLGYGAYMTFSEFCKGHLPDIPDQHIAQMVAGIDVILWKPDAELRRLARLAIDSGVDAAFAEGRTPEEIDAELAESDAGRAWLAELEQIKDPWFNMATGDGLYHYYGSWLDDPSIPYASLIGHVAALKAGEDIERPTEQLARERDRLAEEYGSLLDEEARKGFEELLALSRTVFPYVEEHKFFCDYWFLTRWWNKIREFGALLAEHGFLAEAEDVFQLSRHEVNGALDELVLTWSTGGEPIGPKHWPPIVARRKEILERLADWTPPPALGAVPEAVTDPALVMLWGVTTERVQEWARSAETDGELTGTAASPGRGRRAGAGGQDREGDLGHPRGRDPRLHDHLARLGADLLQDRSRGHRHRRRDVARRDRLPRVRPPGRRRHGPRDLADPHRAVAPSRRLGRHGDDPRWLSSPGRWPGCAPPTGRRSAARARRSAS